MAQTPCIGVCSTGIGDQVCRGCKRFAQEVIDWNAYSNSEQQAVLKRIDGFVVQAVQNKMFIVDEPLLLEKIQFQQIQFNRQKNAYHWLYHLMRQGASQISEPAEFGFLIKSAWKNTPLVNLKELLEQEIYELSCAYYQRYIIPAELALEEQI